MTEIVGFANFYKEFRDFEEDLYRISDEIDDIVDRATGDVALEIERTAKKNAPVAEPRPDLDATPGALKADIQAVRKYPGEWAVGSILEYAPYVEYGTDPHPITPNGIYPLRFMVDGEWVSTYEVKHPGATAQPFLRPALDKHKSELAEEIERGIEEAFADLS